MIGALLIISFLILLVLGAPISMSMGLSTAFGLHMGNYDLTMLPMLLQKGANSYTLVAIPFFVLGANLMNTGGITERIFDFCESIVGWMRGGLAQVNVISSVIFAGISGTANADAAGLGLVEIRAMEKKGYDLGWSTSITLASSVLGPIIPPSVGFIVYAMFAEVSVSDMFMAGILPGVVIAVILMITNAIIAHSGKVACPEPEPFDIKEVWRTFKHGFFCSDGTCHSFGRHYERYCYRYRNRHYCCGLLSPCWIDLPPAYLERHLGGFIWYHYLHQCHPVDGGIWIWHRLGADD